jgi:hypothetical protein
VTYRKGPDKRSTQSINSANEHVVCFTIVLNPYSEVTNRESGHELIQRYLDEIASDEEVQELSGPLGSCSETRSLYLKLPDTHAVLISGELNAPISNQAEIRVLELISNLEESKRILRQRRFLSTVGSIATALLVMLGSWSLCSSRSDRIVEITSIQGGVQCTGDSGNVIEQLQAGQVL